MFYFLVFCLIGCVLSQSITAPIAEPLVNLPESPAVLTDSSFGVSVDTNENVTQNLSLPSPPEQRVGQLVEQPIQLTVPQEAVQTNQQLGEVRNEVPVQQSVPNQPSLTLQQTFSFEPSDPVQNQPQFQEIRNAVPIQQTVPIQQRFAVPNQPQFANIRNIEPIQSVFFQPRTVPVQNQPQFIEIQNVDPIQEQFIPVNQQVVQPVVQPLHYTNQRLVVSGTKTGNVRVVQPIRNVLLQSPANTLARTQSDIQSVETTVVGNVGNTRYVPQTVQLFQRFYVPQVQRYYQPVPQQLVQPINQPIYNPQVIRTESIANSEAVPNQVNPNPVPV